MGCSLWGCTESDTTEVTAASAAPFHCLPYVLYLFIWEWAFRLSPVCLVTQLCLTLCDPKDCSPPASAVHGDSSGKNNGVGCHALLKGIFPTQGSNPGLAHCRQILYRLSYIVAAAAAKSLQSCPTLCDPIDGSPSGSTVPGILQARTLEWVAISFSNA